MFKWALALIYLITSASVGVSQYFDASALTLYDEFEIPKGEDLQALHRTRTASVYLISTKPGALYLRPLADSTLSPTKVLSIKSNDTKKLIRQHLMGDSIVGLVKSINKDRSESFEVVIYTLIGNQLAEAHRQTVTLKNRPTDKNAEPVFFQMSRNGQYAAVLRQVAFESSADAKIDVEVIQFPDNTSNTFKLPLPYASDDIKVTNAEITTEGIVNFTVSTGIKLNSPFLRKYLVYSFNPETKDLREFDLSRDKIYVQEMVLKSQNEQLGILTTHTSDPMAKTTSNGMGWVCVDSNGRYIATKKTQAFSETLTESLRLNARSKSGLVEHLIADDIVSVGGQSIGLLHQQYRDQVCTTDPRTGILTCTDQYHHDGIIIQYLNDSIDPIVVNRSQIDYDQEGPYMGYSWFTTNQNLWLFYNDHQRNTTIEADRTMNNPVRSSLRYVIISNKGTVNSSAIDISTGRGMVLMPSTRGFKENDMIYQLFSNGRDFQIGRLDLKKLNP